MITALLAAALATPACTAQASAPGLQRCVAAAPNWRTTATEDDRRRIRRWRDAWTEALAQARTGNAADIAREGALLEPDAALPQPLPPAGDYNCRTIKIGTPTPDLLNYIAYPPFRCRIRREGGHLTLTKLTGSQRPVGRLFADSERRLVFLGTMQLGDESRAFQYGVDQDRDMAGLLERVGERRWRLVFPYPHYESLLDVIELTP
jgi:hypothetical protein